MNRPIIEQVGEYIELQRRIHGANSKAFVHTKNCAHCGKPRGKGHPACSRALQKKHASQEA